jgi:isoamylase
VRANRPRLARIWARPRPRAALWVPRPRTYDPAGGLRFNSAKLLIDPYARALAGETIWRDECFGYRVGDPAADLSRDDRDSAPFVPKGVVVDPAFDWEDDRPPRAPWHRSILYELHVKGFTARHPALPAPLRGTYAGLASPAALEYLTDLGVTAVELLPVHHHLDEPALAQRGLVNYWGYNTIAFFAPDSRYASPGRKGAQVREFKAMVEALHRAGSGCGMSSPSSAAESSSRAGPSAVPT